MTRRKDSVAGPDFRTLFEAAPGCYLVLDPKLFIVAVSDAYLNATMTQRDDIIGRGLFDVFPDNPGDTGATGENNLRASLQKVLQAGKPDTMAVQKYDIRRPEAEGGAFEERFWSPVNMPVLDAAHNVAYIIHRVEDVTEFVRLSQQRKKQNEISEELRTRAGHMEAEIIERSQELQNANKLLSENQLFLEAVIENLPNMVFVKEARELRFVLFNKAGEELLGFNRADLKGKNDYDFFPKDQADFFIEKDRAVLQSNTLLDIPEEPIQTRHHGTRVLHTKKIPIHDASGAPIYLLGISDDITEAKAAQEKIRLLNEKLESNVTQLEAANRELEAFSYSVSHDLRSPLRSMNGFSKILMTEFTSLSEQKRNEYLMRITGAADKMSTLIDGLLTLSRLSRQELRRRAVDLTALARTVLGDLAASEPERAVTVAVQEGLVVQGDAALLEVVMQNLLHNAWKFSANKTRAEIEIGRCTDDAGALAYFVRDNGAGFNMAYKNKLFGSFQRLHLDSEFEGNGIGLATVQRAIQRHGGRVWGESELGRGATFYFTLP